MTDVYWYFGGEDSEPNIEMGETKKRFFYSKFLLPFSNETFISILIAVFFLTMVFLKHFTRETNYREIGQ